jgi:hypothetical protein
MHIKAILTYQGALKKAVLKDEGMGVMISALHPREFGLGLRFTKEQMMRASEARIGQQYKDVDAAKK